MSPIRRQRVAIVCCLVLSVLAIVIALLLRYMDDVRDPSPHRSGVVIAHGVSVDYLDWGGNGTVPR